MINYQIAIVLNPQGDGTYTWTLPWPNTVKREDGSPSEAGDVASVQPDGTLQARPKGTAQSWERCTLEGVALKFSGAGPVVLLLPSDVSK